ncbi:DUF4421 domain-containing protein [Ohtaekwangia koreensis]|uniref:DUF4421 domain-containing protein n=1 Tax=Ohtaekwangia koreensis TaxID=688867 RepID=A0A1T5J0I2_9BACT|nr:DUF4421 domain-containing protein [Ohtaekwangia koreensis]SKC44864.1 protein of unknown function [Ohtaekwangia koreensis]
MAKLISVVLFVVWAFQGMAQSDARDTTYYATYDKIITARFYFSQKYTSYQYRDDAEGIRLRYKPNTTLNMGVGATYKWATLNLAYGFGFLNRDEAKGKTKYLDLQTHIYGRKLIIDAFGQFYTGFYMNKDEIEQGASGYYLRPDIKVRYLGASGQYLFNHKRFSYRASFLQSEWQKKSAGSLLAGVEFFLGRSKADSSIVPAVIRGQINETDLNQVDFFDIGPNIGYIYTFVYKKHFYITGQATVSLDYGIHTLRMNGENKRSSVFSPNSSFSFFAGYNSKTWALSFIFVNKNISIASEEDRIDFNTGNLRFNIVHRFVPHGKTKRVLKEVIR